MTNEIKLKLLSIIELTNRAQIARVVCDECGNAFGATPKTSDRISLSTYIPGICDICEKTTIVTEFRDFGFVRKT